MTFYDPKLGEGSKKGILRYFRSFCFSSFSCRSMNILKYFKSMLPVCDIFSGLHYSSENLKDCPALFFLTEVLSKISAWLQFSHDLSILPQHTFSLYVNNWVLRLIIWRWCLILLSDRGHCTQRHSWDRYRSFVLDYFLSIVLKLFFLAFT